MTTVYKKNNLRPLNIKELNYYQINRKYKACESCGKIAHEYNYCVVCVWKGLHISYVVTHEPDFNPSKNHPHGNRNKRKRRGWYSKKR